MVIRKTIKEGMELLESTAQLMFLLKQKESKEVYIFTSY